MTSTILQGIDWQMDSLGRIVLSDHLLDAVTVDIEAVVAGGDSINSVCNAGSNGFCSNGTQCIYGSNAFCTNSGYCQNTHNGSCR